MKNIAPIRIAGIFFFFFICWVGRIALTDALYIINLKTPQVALFHIDWLLQPADKLIIYIHYGRTLSLFIKLVYLSKKL